MSCIPSGDPIDLWPSSLSAHPRSPSQGRPRTGHNFRNGCGQNFRNPQLQAVRDAGDWEGWLAFFLHGIAEVSAEATETARRILALREQHRAAITEQLGRAAGNGHRVLESLFDRPIVSVAEVQALIGTTFAAANTIVSRLSRLGILHEVTGYARYRRFRYEPYVRLFSEAETDAP